MTPSWPGPSWPGGWTGPTTRTPDRAWSRRPATTAPRTPWWPSWSGCPTGRPTTGSGTSSARSGTRRRPEPSDRARPGREEVAGSAAGGLLLLVVGDLLGAAPAEQSRAGESLHHLAQVLHGVHQVVHVGAHVPE